MRREINIFVNFGISWNKKRRVIEEKRRDGVGRGERKKSSKKLFSRIDKTKVTTDSIFVMTTMRWI